MTLPTHDPDEPDPKDPPARVPAARKPDETVVGRPTVDDLGEWSFPASDPPASWTWETER